MKSLRLIGIIALTLITVFCHTKEEQVLATDLPVLPGGVSRPYEVICEVTNFQNVPLKFANGSGAGGSFYMFARKGMEVIRSYAKEQGADAVIDMKFEFIVFNNDIYQLNRYEGSMGSVFLIGTMIRYTDKKK